MVVRRTLFATVAAWLAFLIYLRTVVPWVEGQSADRVPEIDLLGVLRVEQPGQWLSLFPADAWQRDESNRNIIHADGNIVMFRDYQHEADGSMRVKGLTLLLFEEGLAGTEDSGQESSLVAERPLAVGPQVPRIPVVIEAFDDAILRFDSQKAVGLNRYGELKEVKFLGDVKFWKGGPIPEDRFAIKTRELTITGSEAKTTAQVEFEFGPTTGLANGLHLTFENSGSLHSENAALTKISGMRHMRLQNVERLDMQPSGAKQPISLSCIGPGEFSFGQLAAKFFDRVEVIDHDTGYQIRGEAMWIQFQSTAPHAARAAEKSILPTEMVAQDLWVYGPPASVLNPEEEFHLRSTMLHYNVDRQEFVAGALPRSGVESWMLDATQSENGQTVPNDVEVARGDLVMRCPSLRYRSTSQPKAAVAGRISEWSNGEFTASGPGTLWYHSGPNKNPIVLKFFDRLTAHPDPDDASRWLISILGQTEAELDARSQVQADALYLWLHKVPSVAGSKPTEVSWEPDLLLAQGHVRLAGEKVRAAVREARVYFPQPLPVSNSAVAVDQAMDRPTATNPAGSGAVAPVKSEESQAPNDSPLEIRGADVTADAMIVQLDWAAPSGQVAEESSSETTSVRYQVETIDLDGAVVVEEAVWNGTERRELDRLPGYRMFGDRIVGVAADSSSPGDSARLARTRGGPPKSAEFVWTLSAKEDRQARLITADADLHCGELHYDQSQHLAWANRPGTISFEIPPDLRMDGNESRVVVASAVERSTSAPGRGSAKWQRGLQFNGRDFALDGQVQLEIERPKNDQQVERVQAYGERMLIELSDPIKLDGSESGSNSRSAKRVALYPAEKPDASGSIPPVRLYHQQRTIENELIAQQVVWATGVEMEPKQNRFLVSGPGSFWTIRQGTNDLQPAPPSSSKPNTLTFLKVQFQRSMEGQWSEGQIQLFGPVSALYGKAPDWQIMDQESRLLQPLRITSDSMTINRWQATPQAEPELEWEADGRVHVLGEQFEGTAQRINFAQSQDLLTMRGDGRAPAKFWQTNATTAERNHLAAQKIWYRPKQEDFHFEGFQEGNLNFFSGRRGGLNGN